MCLALLLLAGQALLGVDPQDEGQFLTYPWLIANGHMPYRDIWMSYPPATYLILALLFKLGAPGLVAERGLGLVARVAYVILVNRTITKSWTRFSCLGVSVAFSLVFISSDIKAYPWLVALPFLFLDLLTASGLSRPPLCFSWQVPSASNELWPAASPSWPLPVLGSSTDVRGAGS